MKLRDEFFHLGILGILGIGTLLGVGPGFGEEPKAIKICGNTDSRPFFFSDEHGDWRGVEYDLLKSFADSEGMALTVLNHFPFSAPRFPAEKCDVAAWTMTHTLEREKIVDFSPGYFPVRVMAVEPKSSLTTHSRQLKGKKVATVDSGTFRRAAENIGEVEIIEVDTYRDMFDAVSQGRADFLAMDSAGIISLLEEYPDLHITVPLSERQNFAFAMAKDSIWTEPLTQFMDEARKSGKMAEILERYFTPDVVTAVLDQD